MSSATTSNKRNNFYGKGSVVVPSDGEGAVRRLAITADRLVTRPFDGIDVIPDVVAYAARTYGSREAVGWRNIVAVHEEEKEVKKTVGGKEVVETKKWKYFELSDYEYISYLDLQERIFELARGLLHHGVLKTDVFNIYAQTRWVFGRVLGFLDAHPTIVSKCELAAHVARLYDNLDTSSNCLRYSRRDWSHTLAQRT